MTTRLLSLLPVLLLALSTFAQQQIYLPWEFAGGPPCPVRDVVLHAGILYAGTDCGLYKKPESGGVWEQQVGTPDSTVLFLAANAGAVVAVFRQIGGYYYTGNSALYFFSSTDNGASFVQQYRYDYNNWYDTYGYVPIQTDFSQLYAFGDSTFVLAARRCEYGCKYVRVVSTNNGQNWSDEVLPGFYYRHPLNPSAEQGDTIATFDFDQLVLFNAADLQQLAAIPIVPPLDSAVAGLTWVNNRLAVTFEKGSYAYADTLGQQWISGSLPLSGVNAFFYYNNYYYWCASSGFYRSPTIGPVVLETLYAHTGPLGDIHKAQRGTNGWYLLTNGVLLQLPDGSNTALPVTTEGMGRADGTLNSLPGRLMFRSDNGLWWQSLDANTWSIYENETAYRQHFQDFYVDDTFCLAYAKPSDYQSSIYRSVDGGVTWSFSINSYGYGFVKNLRDDRVYFNNIFTSDGGLHWDTIPQFFSPTAALGDTLLTNLYANGGRLSFDHGQSWQNLFLPTPSASYTEYYAYPLVGNTLYAFPASSLPVYRLIDFGTTWEVVGTGVSTNSFFGAGSSYRAGLTTWLHDGNTLSFFSPLGQNYFVVENAPFKKTVFRPGYYYARKDFGRIVQKDSTVYAARQRGVWRVSDCYTEHPLSVPPRDTAICQGNAVVFHGDTLRTAGTYVQRIPGLTTLCDSLDVLRLQVNLTKATWYKQICTGDTLLWNGQAYSGDGTYIQQLSNANGCDSSVTLYLSAYAGWSSASYTLCAGDSLQLNGQTISAPGQYTFHLTSFAGCDSTLMLNVYDGPDTLEYAPTICAGASYMLFDQTYTEAGEYWFSRIVPSNPCPFLYHVLLTVKPDEAIALDTFVTAGTVIYGHTISSDTTFTVLVAGPNSCDKTLTITAHTTVGVNDLNTQQAAQAFPNPFNDQLNFRWPIGESAQVRLYDAQGRLWREARLAGPTSVWETRDLPTGFYRVEMQVGGRHFAWKMVKMR